MKMKLFAATKALTLMLEILVLMKINGKANGMKTCQRQRIISIQKKRNASQLKKMLIPKLKTRLKPLNSVRPWMIFLSTI